MFTLLKVLVNLVFLGGIILAIITWDKTEKFLDLTLFKNTTKKVKNMTIIGFTIFLELIILLVFSLSWRISFIDTLFTTSLLLLCSIWLIPFFTNYQRNLASVSDKHFSGGVEVGKIKVFQFTFTPFILGSIIFSISGIIITSCYYYQYFL